jgi:hypothetical protein
MSWLFWHGDHRVGTQYSGDCIKKNVHKVGCEAAEQGNVPGKLAVCGF